jgi:hypothetical protein
MKVDQIAVFLENKSGRLAAITKALSDNNINIRALSVADTADFGILRLIVDDTDKATRVLKDEGFTVGKAVVIAVEVADRPGGLARVLAVLHEAGMNVDYMYAVLIFRFDDPDMAITILQNAGIRILTGEEVRSI